MKKFNKPVNKWLEEEVNVEVNVPKLNPKTGKIRGIEKVDMPATERTYYSDSPPKTTVCGNHYYECVDKHKYIFKCKHCNYHRIAHPVTYNLVNGKLIRRPQDK
jgi:hypothetical protein